MSLRRTTLIYFILATLGLFAVSLLSLNRILKPHFLDQQKTGLSLNLLRAEKAVAQRQDDLLAWSAEWARDLQKIDTLRQDSSASSADFISPVVAAELNLSLIALVDPQGELIFLQSFPHPDTASGSLPDAFSASIQSGSPLLSSTLEKQPLVGLLEIDGKPAMIAAQPVFGLAPGGEVDAALIALSLLNRDATDRLDELLQLSVSILPVSQADNQPEMAVAVHEVQAGGQPYILFDEQLISGYDLLEDIYGQAAFLIQVEEFPSIYKNGELVFNYIIIALIMSGITFITILFLLIEGNVLSRLRQLSEDVAAVGRSGDINRRLSVRRKDELGQLGVAINSMLTALQRAVSQRQESEERFQKLVESMDDVVFTIDRESQQVQVYGKYATKSELLGEGTLVEKLNQLIRELGDQIEHRKDLLEKTYAGENTGLEWTTIEHGSERSYYAALSPMQNPEGKTTTIVGVSRDVTDLKKLEKELRQRANEFGALYETSQLLLSQIDIDAIQESICHLAVDKMGLDSAWIGRISSDGSLLEPVASHAMKETDLIPQPLYQDAAPNPHPAVRAFFEGEMRIDNRMLMRRGASEDTLIPVSIASIPLNQGSAVPAILTLIKRKPDYFSADQIKLIRAFGNLSGVALQNTYLFKQVLNGRERLKSVSRRLVEIQEEERRRIALELHDEIGQILTGLRLSVDMVNTLPPDQIAGHTATIIEIINDLISRVRQMSLELRPSMLDDLGILPTIIWHIDRYTSQTGITVNLHQTNVQNRRFRSEIETTVYRVVQEALTNIARHASVKNANIRLWCTEKILGVQIEDEGKGFEPDEAFSTYHSRGLLGMRERVGFIGGQLLVVSQPGQGTTLTIEIPLEGRLERRQHDR